MYLQIEQLLNLTLTIDKNKIECFPNLFQLKSILQVMVKQNNRTSSFGYFVSPLLVRYSLIETGWENTLFYFCLLLGLGLIVALFVSTPKIPQGVNQDNNQTAKEASFAV